MSANKLIRGDALAVCRDVNAGFGLVYMDPPYATGLVFKTRAGEFAYDDRFSVETLIGMLEPRIASIRDRMLDGAAMFLHFDNRAVYAAKVTCDRVFGSSRFQGEIIWVPGNGARGKGLPSTHQTILVYTKSGELVWNSNDPATREPYAEGSIKTHFRKTNAEVRAYRERVVNGKTYTYFADEGKAVGSVWTDIPAMAANSPIVGESTGYPTQKPERLLERIVVGASKPGAMVADLMCGSGTTLVVAARLGRNFIGADIGKTAFDCAYERLTKAGVEFDSFQ